jgi:transcriptional regulator with XRE-family HTH domain
MQATLLTAFGGAIPHCSAMERPILSTTDHRAQVGHRLDLALKAAAVDQVTCGEIMGVSKQSITDYIKGRVYPTQYGCYRLHKATGITYDWLFLGDWGALPARLADKLRPDIASFLADAAGLANQEA